MEQDFAVGDYIVDSSYIYEITAVRKQEGRDASETMLDYKPTWGSDKIFTASIPVGNLKKAGTRRVFSKAEVEQVTEYLKTLEVENQYNTIAAKELVYNNNPKGVISVLVYYWKTANTLTKIDKDLMEQILLHLCHEIALVTDKKYLSVRNEVTAILDKRN